MALDDKPSADGRRSFIKNTALFLAAMLSTPAAGAQKVRPLECLEDVRI